MGFVPPWHLIHYTDHTLNVTNKHGHIIMYIDIIVLFQYMGREQGQSSKGKFVLVTMFRAKTCDKTVF